MTDAASSIHPSKGTFDNPAPRKFFPLMRLDFLGNVHPALLRYFGDKRAAIACIFHNPDFAPRLKKLYTV